MRALVDAHEPSLLRYAHSLLGDPELARDVVQEAFLKLWSGEGISDATHAKKWLFVVCRNLCMDQRRRQGRHERSVELLRPRADRRGEPAALARLTLTQVALAIEALPESQQELLRLRLQAGLSYKAIAEVTGLSVSNVGYQLHHAIRQVREAAEITDAKALVRVE